MCGAIGGLQKLWRIQQLPEIGCVTDELRSGCLAKRSFGKTDSGTIVREAGE